MKKVLSLVLAVMMVVGMTTVAFAAIEAKPLTEVKLTFKAGTDLLFGTEAAGAFTSVAASDIGVKVTTKDAFGDFTKPVAASDYKASVTAKDGVVTVAVKFVNEGEYAVDIEDVTNNTTTIPTVYVTTTPGADPTDPATVTYTTATNDVDPDAQVVTVAKADPTEPVEPETPAKNVPTKAKITGFVKDYKWEPTAKSESLEEADQKSYLPLTADMFTWDDGVSYGKDAKFRASQLKDIGVRRVYQKGTANTIRDAELRTSDFDVRVRTVKFYPLTKETDVELKLSLTFKGSTKNAPEYEYNFTIANDEEIIEDGQSETASYGNIYLKADATVRNVEFQGDDDEIVYATKTVVKGQKYYFNVTSELEKEDEQIIADNPEVDSIYNVYQNNMANATVQFKNLDREFFVYDGEGKLLGTTKDSKLPLAKKYILTTAKVDFGGADEEPVEETPEEPADVDAPPMGGGEVPPSNNYNPNTGL